MKSLKIIFPALFLMIMAQQSYATAQDDLFAAAMQCDLPKLNKALDAGAEVNGLHSNGQNALAMAIFCPDATKILLEKGCDPNGGSYPAIISAANNYSVEVMKILLDGGADPNAPGTIDAGKVIRDMLEKEKAKKKKANKALITAWENQLKVMQPTKVYAIQQVVQQTNCVPCLKILLEKGAKTDIIADGNLYHTIAAFSMSKEGRIKAFAYGKKIMEDGGFKLPDWYGNMGDDINGSSREMIDLLATTSLDINAKNSAQNTPLIIALRGLIATPEGQPNKIDAAKAFLKNGADPKITAKNEAQKNAAVWHPICIAAEGCDVELMEMILEKGADVNATTATSCLSMFNGSWGGDGYTPLIIACMYNNIPVASLLVDKGGDLKTGTNGYSIMSTSNENVKCLVSTKNKTPIYWAIEKNDLALIEKIAKKMTWKFNPDFSYKVIADTERENFMGMTIGCKKGKSKLRPSMYASEFEHKEAYKILVDKGL